VSAMTTSYDHWIETREIPAIGGALRYAAKPRVREISSGVGRDISLQEFFGRTADEAEEKAQAALDAWLAQRETAPRS